MFGSIRLGFRLWLAGIIGAIACVPYDTGKGQDATQGMVSSAKEESLSLLKVPTVRLTRISEPAEADIRKIKGLIADLAKTESPDFGLSPTLTGDAFAPIASSGHFGMGLLTSHGLKRNSAFTSLVELGPKALPFLLESLDDKTPTKLTINHGGFFGAMWFGHEIDGNPVNKHETEVLPDVKGDKDFPNERIVQDYTVKVGDVCFVAVGQITNRSYNAVRYQPTACIVLNSTVQDKKLAAEVRAIWGKSDHRQKLLDSLMVDFHTRGDRSEYLQTGAAMRLAYYFPEATEDLIVARLKGLDIAATDVLEQTRIAGVRIEDFVKAVSWSSRPGIRAELLDIFRKTADSEVLLAALPGIGKENDELVFRRIKEQLDGLPKDEPGPYCKGYDLLIALGNRFPDRAEGVFQNYLKPGTIERRRPVSLALRETCGHLAVRLLTPLLEDKRDFGWNYAVNPKANEPRLPIRVCDEAAETIAMNSKVLKFVMEGSHENLDRQIEVMRRAVVDMNKPK